jgi:hypothetical protein
MTATRRLGHPVPVTVRAAEDGQPVEVDGIAVEGTIESWLIEDRWWTPRPLRRRYWEVLTVDGRARVVFRDLVTGTWFAQR